MPRYLTTTQYRRFDEGMPGLDQLSDDTLNLYIQRAESAIDSYVGFEARLAGFDARKTVFYQEGFAPSTRKTRIPTFPVPVRQILRYQIHISNAGPLGNPLVATISPSDCVINEFEGYVEIVPLQAITYSLTPVIAQLGLQPPLVVVDMEVGYYLPTFGEILSDIGDHQTYRATRGFWAQTYTQALHVQPFILPPVPPVVYSNGVVQSGNYTVNWMEGQVTFATPQSASSVISVDYTFTIPDPVRDAAILQTSYLLGQRYLNQLGLQGIEQVRSGDQTVKRHLRTNAGSSNIDEQSIVALAMQLLAPYKMVPIA